MKMLASQDKLTRAAILLYLPAGLLLAFLISEEWLPRLFQDDAFFYFSIARNFAEEHGSTFDGLNLTNGYHPAWMFLLSIYHKLTPLQGMGGLRSVIVLHTILNTLTWIVMAHTLRTLGVRSKIVGLGVITAIFVVGFSNYGMEASLWLLTFWLVVLTFYRVATGQGGYLPAAAAVVLAFGARSDSILFVAPLALVTTMEAYRRSRVPKTLVLSGLALWLPFIAGLAVQAAVNMHYFGDPRTISSSLKTNPIGQQFALLGTAERGINALMHKGVFVAVFLLALYFSILLLRKLKEADDRQSARFLLALNVYVLAFLSLIALTLREPPRTWYYTVAFTILIGAAAWLRSRSESQSNTSFAVASAAVCIASLLALFKLYGSSPRGNALATAAWVRQNLGPDEAAFVSDGSGIVNYFAERHVINGDGLVNNFEYQRYVREKRVREYLEKNRVRYVLANVNSPDKEPEGEVNVFVHNWRGPNFVYATADAADAKAVYTTRGGFFGFVIFDVADLRFKPAY